MVKRGKMMVMAVTEQEITTSFHISQQPTTNSAIMDYLELREKATDVYMKTLFSRNELNHNRMQKSPENTKKKRKRKKKYGTEMERQNCVTK